MKIKIKKLFSLLLVSVACLCGLFACHNIDGNGNGGESGDSQNVETDWALVFVVESGVVKGLSEYGKTLNEIIIPESINGVDITTINSRAFEACKSLVSVIVPSGITNVGYNVFQGCSSLTIYCEVESKPSGWNYDWNPSSCPVVWDCDNNEVADDGFIYKINSCVRYGIKNGVATVVKQPTNITTANISKNIIYKGNSYGVTSIGNGAFRDCKDLTNIVMPNGIATLFKCQV